jgi:hypothetical protein
MYAAVVSSTLVAGLVAVGAAAPTADTSETRQSVRVASCTQSAHLYPQMDSAERAACQSTYTPYVGLLPGR